MIFELFQMKCKKLAWVEEILMTQGSQKYHRNLKYHYEVFLEKITLENLWISITQWKNNMSQMSQWKHIMMSKKMMLCLLIMMNLKYITFSISFRIPLKTMVNFANFWWVIIVMFWLSDFKIRINMHLLLFYDEYVLLFSFYFSFYVI